MSFFTRKDMGRIYVIRMELPDGEIIHKIGMCFSDRATDRMMELLRSWFVKYRYVPYAELRLDMACYNPKEVEKYIHRILDRNRYSCEHKVQGSTEMFRGVDEVRLLVFLRRFKDSVDPYCPELDKSGYDIVNGLLSYE